MLPSGSQVIGCYRGCLDDGTVIDQAGSLEHPVVTTIGDHRLPGNVSHALSTMQPGETRIVKVPFRQKGQRLAIAAYEVSLVSIPKIDSVLDEQLHGAECACGCHKLRESLVHTHS